MNYDLAVIQDPPRSLQKEEEREREIVSLLIFCELGKFISFPDLSND